ncbi:HNH endonuclease signature motif containing protein [Microbacterium lacticum]
MASRVRVAEDGVTEIAIKMKKGWSQEQIDAMVTKINQVNERNPVVTRVLDDARNPSATSIWRGAGREFESGKDVDHILDLRLGGRNVLDNMQLLDRSVYRSFGAQIGNAIRHGYIEVETNLRITVF